MDLTLHLKRIWFDQIKSGEKKVEYRLYTSYWIKRLVKRKYDKIILLLGYPKKGTPGTRIERDYCGYEIEIIRHPEWNYEPQKCFVIYL